MWTTVRYIFLTAIRDWLFVGLFVGMLIACGISLFLGSTALVEEAQMSLAYIGGSTRIILLVGLITFVCFHVRRTFENREVEVILSRPISRTTFVVAYWLGFAVVALLLILPLLSLLAIMPGVSLSGLAYWGASLMLESFIVVAFALFCALILRSAVSSVLLCFGFYFIARMMGFFLYVIDAPHLFKGFGLGWVTGQAIRFVSSVLPRLDLYGHTSWLTYGAGTAINWELFLIQTIIYVPLLLAAALFDFKRKQF